MKTETYNGHKIHLFDDLEPGVKPSTKRFDKCAGCGVPTPYDYHFGVYVSTVSYAIFHSDECACANGDRVYAEVHQ
jgi:hypothetical protein